MEEAIRKADVLIEALPYIKDFHRKILVIKYGAVSWEKKRYVPGSWKILCF